MPRLLDQDESLTSLAELSLASNGRRCYCGHCRPAPDAAANDLPGTKRRREACPHHKGASRFYDMRSADADDLLNVSAARLARSSLSQLHRGLTTSVSVLLNCKFSAVGQSRRFVSPLTASGLLPTADITHRDHHVRKVPQADSVSPIAVRGIPWR